MLFRKKIDPRCAYCAKGTRISDEEVACVKCGIVAAEHHCGAFRYDPLKRISAPSGEAADGGAEAGGF